MPFYFWTVILGMAIGATLTWFLVADHPFETREAPAGPVDDLEAGVIGESLEAEGTELSDETIVRVLELHGRYIVGRHYARRRAESASGSGDDGADAALDAGEDAPEPLVEPEPVVEPEPLVEPAGATEQAERGEETRG